MEIFEINGLALNLACSMKINYRGSKELERTNVVHFTITTHNQRLQKRRIMMLSIDLEDPDFPVDISDVGRELSDELLSILMTLLERLVVDGQTLGEVAEELGLENNPFPEKELDINQG